MVLVAMSVEGEPLLSDELVQPPRDRGSLGGVRPDVQHLRCGAFFEDDQPQILAAWVP
jgi:hypothetical protein